MQPNVKRRHTNFFNSENCDFKASKQWTAVQAAFPRIAEVCIPPRIPNVIILTALDKLTGSSFAKKSNPCKSLDEVIACATHCCDTCVQSQIKLAHEHVILSTEYVYNMHANDSHNLFNYCEIMFSNCVYPTTCLIDTGALHGSYGASWIKDLGVWTPSLDISICSPINNSCVSVSDIVNIRLLIYDECKINKYELFINLKILPSLDTKPFHIIIGLPDIKKNNLVDKFANQFSMNAIHAMPENTDDALHSLEAPALHHFDLNHAEDDEVAQHDYWDDAWVKNAVSANANTRDILDSIKKHVTSATDTFLSDTLLLIEKWSDLFSRTLSATPADLPPLVIDVDTTRWMTKTSNKT